MLTPYWKYRQKSCIQNVTYVKYEENRPLWQFINIMNKMIIIYIKSGFYSLSWLRCVEDETAKIKTIKETNGLINIIINMPWNASKHVKSKYINMYISGNK